MASYPPHLRGAHRPSHPWHCTWVSWKRVVHRCRGGVPGYEGVTIDPRWRAFGAFAEDMGPRPSAGWSIDRIDNAKGYEPGNCRWAKPDQQARNRRTTRLFQAPAGIKGEATLIDWAQVFDRDPRVLRQRLRRGWDLARVLDTPTSRGFVAGVEADRRNRRDSMRRLRSRQIRTPDCLAT